MSELGQGLLEKLDVNSSDVQNMKPSELEQTILDANDYVKTLQGLYNQTDGDSVRYEQRIVDFMKKTESSRSSIKQMDALRNDEEYNKEGAKLFGHYKDYRENMETIEKNGRTKMNATIDFFTEFRTFAKTKYIGAHKDGGKGIVSEYIGNAVAEAPPGNPLEGFRLCLNSNNSVQFLTLAYQINRHVEDLRQLRDAKIAGVQLEKGDHLYSYGDHGKFVKESELDSTVSKTISKGISGDKAEMKNANDDAEHLRHIQAEKELADRFDANGVGEVLNDKVLLSYLGFNPNAYVQSLNQADAKAAAELSDTRKRATGEKSGEALSEEGDSTTELLSHMIKRQVKANEDKIPGYASKAVDSFISSALPLVGVNKDAGADQKLLSAVLEEKSGDLTGKLQYKWKKSHNKSGNTWNVFENDNDIKKMESVKLDRNSSEKVQIGIKSENGKDVANTVGQEGLSDALASSASADFFSGIAGGISFGLQVKKLNTLYAQIKELREKGNDVAAADLMSEFASGIWGLISTGENALQSISKGGVEAATAAGAISLGAARTAEKVFQDISGGMTIAKGVYDSFVAINHISQSNKAIDQAQKSAEEIKKMTVASDAEKKEAMKKQVQGLRISKRVEQNQRQKRAESIVDLATAGASIVQGTLSLVPTPGTSIAAKAVGLLASAASLAAKFFISKHFKGKKTEEAWLSVLGYSAEKYRSLLKQMGGKSAERFHNVLRRKTGVATRQDYADSLAVTDAIDLFAAARAYPLVNRENGGDPINDEQVLVKQEMDGIGFKDPKAYGAIKLQDIAKGMGIATDWKATLRHAITNNMEISLKEDLTAGQAKDILKGKKD